MTKSIKDDEIKVSHEVEKKLSPANDNDWGWQDGGDDDTGDHDNW
ncbi:hypothetical protein [Kitasatospora kifunensis]|uniref:Uncharacterized protein n=1 Tax=Kitasatospora kifunensis TaxID=58351 RepID=A0A7W7RCA7_KITKI|nr:hypothetical protein [Kitasatospora kifunensis]MBB4928766.1 hypothetical protein [Kitasatospora kifunensis]